MSKINKVLIANRGEIACRILHTLARMSIPSVVVYHAIDADSPAVRAADEAVEIHGVTPVAAYLDMDMILEACGKTKADAVHPGFGFLAENAGFASRLTESGITFIGPDPATIELMGDKVAARAFCLECGFPLAPSVVNEGCDTSFSEQAAQLGFPLLIKAAAGGGGKGMHIVHDQKDLDSAIKLARGEALRAFGNDAVYAEHCVTKARHIEVQILADHQGQVFHLGERECSIQRRFQKIIEESPAPNLAAGLREEICATAVRIATQAKYRNAGTVEFMVTPENEFYFLEMNTRIQVEHPVTEMVTGIDLVEMQIHVARGEALPISQNQITSRGHAVEVRLYAEDPEKDFLPATGRLLACRLPAGDGLRVDKGIHQGMPITSAFDPMLAKLISHGKNRQEAIARALEALEATILLGVDTNAEYLSRILSHPAYETGQIDTGFTVRYSKDLKAPILTDDQRALLLAAAALNSHEFIDTAFDVPEPHASIGNWRN